MKISVITVTWNSASTLRHTMESVLEQDYAQMEHIIVDGASSDGTMDIVRELEPRYAGRLRYVSEADNGLYDAMNKGLSMAQGEVVGFLNSDDFYSAPDVLSTVAAEMQREGVDAVYGDIHYVHEDDLSRCVRYYSSAVFSRWLMRLGFMPAHPSFYCRLSAYRQWGGFDTDYKIGADFENLLRLIFVHRISTRYISKDFVTMRLGGASTSGMASHRQILREHQRAFRQNGVYSNLLLESLRYLYKIMEVLLSKLGVLRAK